MTRLCVVGVALLVVSVGMMWLGAFMVKTAWRDRRSYRFWSIELAAGWTLSAFGSGLFAWLVASPR